MMMMRAKLALLAGGLCLAGCTTTPMTVDCDPFRSEFTRPVPPSDTLREIQADVPPPASLNAAAQDTKAAAAEDYAKLIAMTLPPTEGLTQGAGDDAVLALSGGGQWGAFGAGYLQQLHRERALPRFKLVTGVSTGALQALFVGAHQGAGAQPGAPFLDQLVTEYTIVEEADVVHRRGYLGAALKGAMAKLDPLRLKIEKALCGNALAQPQSLADCPLIEALAAPGAPVVLLGFVEARNGTMLAINVSAIAQAAAKKTMPVSQAQQCITAGALASVAMPFFYQQVQVTSAPVKDDADTTVTYYDGGVRQSLFLVETLTTLDRIEGKAQGAPSRPVYMIRNGPTTARVDKDANGKLNAIDTAQRGYSLIVNQSEVTAIEAIRLRDPKAAMRLATADGFERPFADPAGAKGCIKPEGEVMFDPKFMQCLQAFGRFKATGGNKRPNGWIDLTPSG